MRTFLKAVLLRQLSLWPVKLFVALGALHQIILALTKKMLDTVVRFCMQSTIDAQYVIRLGADPHRVLVTGNTKYDQNYSQVTAAEQERFLAELGFAGAGPVVIAGSTHRGEEEILLDVFKAIRARLPMRHIFLAKSGHNAPVQSGVDHEPQRPPFSLRRRNPGPGGLWIG